LGLNVARGQTVSHEYPLKAVFLLNFAQFTDWPTNAFDTSASPLVIGVLGDDPFGSILDDAVQGETVNGRKFVVERYHRMEDIKTCHILFISPSETKRLDQIVGGLKRKPVLTVSDIDGSAYRGVCVRLMTENNKIHLRINTDALKEAQLTMSSKLLRLAEIVTTLPK
jgi:YfiR/HmsC-like